MKWIALLILIAALAASAFFLMRPDTSPACTARIVAFGDSLVTGYGAPDGEDAFSVLSRNLSVSIENLGKDGDTSARALARIDQVLERKPDIVVVLLGGNDALQRLPVSETEKNLGEILEALTDAGVRPVLAGVIGGFPQDPYAPMYRRLAETYDAPLVPNVLSGILGREDLMSDAIHPNAQGYARIAERLLPAVKEACASSWRTGDR